MMKSLGTAREREIYPNEKQKAKYSIVCQDKILGDSYFRITANYDLSNIASEKVYCKFPERRLWGNKPKSDFAYFSRFGRKAGIIGPAITGVIFAVLTAFVNSFNLFTAARFFVGFCLFPAFPTSFVMGELIFNSMTKSD